jgi:hypothetical protein
MEIKNYGRDLRTLIILTIDQIDLPYDGNIPTIGEIMAAAVNHSRRAAPTLGRRGHFTADDGTRQQLG